MWKTSEKIGLRQKKHVNDWIRTAFNGEGWRNAAKCAVNTLWLSAVFRQSPKRTYAYILIENFGHSLLLTAITAKQLDVLDIFTVVWAETLAFGRWTDMMGMCWSIVNFGFIV